MAFLRFSSIIVGFVLAPMFACQQTINEPHSEECGVTSSKVDQVVDVITTLALKLQQVHVISYYVHVLSYLHKHGQIS